MTRMDVGVKLAGSILEMAKASGADCVAVACPMCQSSLDLRQKDIETAGGKRLGLPVLYITQLLGLCLGVPPRRLGMDRLIVGQSNVFKAMVPVV